MISLPSTLPVFCSAAGADPQFRDTMVIVRQQLATKGAGPEIQAYVEQLMLERHETYKMYATAEADKRRHLLDHVSRLEVSRTAQHPCAPTPRE